MKNLHIIANQYTIYDTIWIIISKQKKKQLKNDNVGGKCDGRNNWWGTKYQILDDNTRVYARNLNGFEYKNSKDQFGCNLYPFKSIDEYFITKVNGMRFWYKWCIDSKTPIDCISYKYVGDPNVAEESWKKNVAYFLM